MSDYGCIAFLVGFFTVLLITATAIMVIQTVLVVAVIVVAAILVLLLPGFVVGFIRAFRAGLHDDQDPDNE